MERLAPIVRNTPNAGAPAIAPLPHGIDALAFVTDPATAQVMAALFGSGGAGRVQFGGVASAVPVLSSAPCPRVLVLDISDAHDPMSHLDQLADLCPPGTGVVIVGNSNHPALVQELQTMGISHYLVKPVAADALRDAILGADAGTVGNIGESYDDGAAYAAAPAANGYGGPLPPQPFPTAPQYAPPSQPVYAPPIAAAADTPSRRAAQAAAFAAAAPAPLPAANYAPPATLPSMGSDPPSRGRSGSDPISRALRGQSNAPAAAPAPSEPISRGVAPIPGVEPLPRPVDMLAFVLDADTAHIVQYLLGPNGAGRAQPGGLPAAVQFLSNSACPKVLVVDIAGIPDPMSHMDKLADVCTPGTSVIVIGDTNDIRLYRDLKGAGVNEYLVKPVQAHMLREAILNSATGATGKGDIEPGKPLVFVVGARGGVGSTMLAINAAASISKDLGKKTILLDMDLQFGGVALALDIDPGHGLREALDRPERVDSMFLNSTAVKVTEQLFVLAAEESVTDDIAVKPESLQQLLGELSRHFDAIVIDLPRHVAASIWPVVSAASAVILMADLSLVGIRDTSRLLAAAKEVVDPSKIRIVMSAIGGDKGAKIDRAEFEAALNRKIDFVLPEDAKAVAAASRAGKPLSEVSGSSKLAGSVRELSVALLGEAPKNVAKAGRFWFRRKKK